MHKTQHYLLRLIEVTSRRLAMVYPLRMFDILYCSAKYKRIFNNNLNLNDPKLLTEKIQWLKIHDRNPIYPQLVDKLKVRDYVSERIGAKYLNSLLGVYSSADEIEFENLPNRYVHKTNHGCGWNIICTDPKKINTSKVKIKMNKWLESNWYHLKGEWVYKEIKPAIFCEEYLDGDSTIGLVDYKFLCFHGKPEFIDFHMNRFNNHTEGIFDVNWKLLAFTKVVPPLSQEIPKPPELSLMLNLAKELSKDLDFCRIDFYNFNHRVIFGEITFYPWSGFEPFIPDDFDYIIGSLLLLRKK